ncbi:MAG: hypothetical protein HC841_05085 [Verrucomicrobiae bacterium]|nr:hypothetical protein [Verrucomicrobiae bacterium]
MFVTTLNEGVQRAIAGEPGEIQDHTEASYAARFTEADYWLDWDQPGRRLHQQCFALTLSGEHGMGPRARIAGGAYRIRQVTPFPTGESGYPPGSLIGQDTEGMTVACADGAVRVLVTPLADNGT